jgi:hypothetical protein
MRKSLEKIVAYVVAIIIIALITAMARVLAHNSEKAFLIGAGAVFGGLGLWMAILPEAAQRLYEKNQQRYKNWAQKHPDFWRAFDEVGKQVVDATELGEALAERIYRKTLWTRILGATGFLFGSLAVCAGLFLAD